MNLQSKTTTIYLLILITLAVLWKTGFIKKILDVALK